MFIQFIVISKEVLSKRDGHGGKVYASILGVDKVVSSSLTARKRAVDRSKPKKSL